MTVHDIRQVRSCRQIDRKEELMLNHFCDNMPNFTENGDRLYMLKICKGIYVYVT